MKQCFLTILTLILLCNSAVHARTFFQKEKDPCIPCEEIQKLRFPEVTILKASKVIPEKKDGKTPSPAKPHCQVLGVIGKEINFEILLPEKWNGRFVMGGNGGFAGELIYSMRETVDSNYVIGGTDVGHKGGLTAKWALNNMERQLNFGHLAIHRTQAVAKAIINQFYCSPPAYSYFVGLSRGGGQAMMEAQRYPDDFDGIAAGFPAFNWVAFCAEFVQNAQKIYPDPLHKDTPVITKANLQLLQKLIMQKCDMLDGVRDSVLTDPRDCHFNVDELPMCPNDRPGTDCFTKAQLLAIKTVYNGVSNKEGQIHPGFPFGGEDERSGWDTWIVGGKSPLSEPSLQAFFGIESLKYLVFNNPDWDYSTYDFSTFFKDTRYASAYLDATDTDYSAFKKRGGKIIFFQGWADPVISALGIVQHYEAAEKKDPQIRDYARLFMLPGVLHMGGKGPDQADWLKALRDWVENGKAPERIVMSKLPKSGEPPLSRPVFPYPHKAVYNGKGDPNKESSFNKSK